MSIGWLLSHQRRYQSGDASDLDFNDEMPGFAGGSSEGKRIFAWTTNRDFH
jgi:hypothetical protein